MITEGNILGNDSVSIAQKYPFGPASPGAAGPFLRLLLLKTQICQTSNQPAFMCNHTDGCFFLEHCLQHVAVVLHSTYSASHPSVCHVERSCKIFSLFDSENV